MTTADHHSLTRKQEWKETCGFMNVPELARVLKGISRHRKGKGWPGGRMCQNVAMRKTVNNRVVSVRTKLKGKT